MNVINGSLNIKGGDYGLAPTANLNNVASTVTLFGNNTVGNFYNSFSGTLNSTGYTLTATKYDVDTGTINANLGTGALITSDAVSLNGTCAADTVIIYSGSTLTLGSAERLAVTASVDL